MKYLIKTSCLLAAALLLTGCLDTNGQGSQSPVVSDQSVVPEATYLSSSTIEAAEDSRSDTALENALVWSEQYAKAVEKLARMQQENHQLSEKGRLQTDQIIKLQQEVKQCRKELDDSNTMLLEMRDELTNWKTNVLGFREEIRNANLAQLDALHRVLKLLGAELDEQNDQSTAQVGLPSGSFK